MATTAKYALRYPALGDAPNVPQDLRNLAEDVDTKLAGVETAIHADPLYTGHAVNASNSIPSGADTWISFATDLMLGGMAGGSKSAEIVVPKAGVYRIVAQANWAKVASGTGYARTQVKLANGTILLWAELPLSANHDITVIGHRDVVLAAGDALTPYFSQNNGAGQTIKGADAYRTYMVIEYLRPSS